MPRKPRAAPSAATPDDFEVLTLADRLDPAAAAPLAAGILARRGRPITVDGGGVRHLGAQCAQVLLSAVATWKLDGVHIRISHPSDELLEAARLLGLGTPELAIEATRA